MDTIKVNGVESKVFTEGGKMFVAVEARELDTTKGYEFGCECEGSKDKLKETEKKFSSAETELAKMTKENAALKKIIEDKRLEGRQARFSSAVKESGTNWTEDDFAMFKDLDDEGFDALLEKFKSQAKAPAPKEEKKPAAKISMTQKSTEAATALFEAQSKGDVLDNMEMPKSGMELNDLANSLMAQYKERGNPIKFHEALEIIRAKRA